MVAGWISITSLFYPKTAQATVFSNNFAYSEAIRLVGAFCCTARFTSKTAFSERNGSIFYHLGIDFTFRYSVEWTF